MRDIKVNFHETGVLVIGAGGAGLRAALAAIEGGASVTVVSRAPAGKGGLTATANGGFHAPVWPGDSPEIHARDLVDAGCGLNDRDLAETLAGEAVDAAKDLERIGARVNWDVPETPAEPEMKHPRSLFIPGKEMLGAMKRALTKSGAAFFEAHILMKLLEDGGRVTGGVFLDMRDASLFVVAAKATVLASGSLGEIFPRSAQEPMGVRTGSTGAGHLAAAKVGAELVDLEMIQFAYVPDEPVSVRGLRCLPWDRMTNAAGEEFLPAGPGPYSHQVAAAIHREYAEGRGPVIMDLRGKEPPHGAGRHPVAAMRGKHMGQCGDTPFKRPVTVGLGALFVMGGVHINTSCETSVPGLFAVGEVSGNAHGARRISGNALTEIIVFGKRAGRSAAIYAETQAAPSANAGEAAEEQALVSRLLENRGGPSPQELREQIQAIMGEHAFMERNEAGLTKALAALDALEQKLPAMRVPGGERYNLALASALDVISMLGVSKAVCTAALARKETRGFHIRTDCENQDATPAHTVVTLADGAWTAGKKPVRGAEE